MATIISKNGEKSHDVFFANSYVKKNDERILIVEREAVAALVAFLEKNGVSQVYFDALADEEFFYNEWGHIGNPNFSYDVFTFYNE